MLDDKTRRESIQKALNQRNRNKYQSVSGKRFSIPCKDHEIAVVYYESERKNAPLILGFHGGGFLFGGNAMNDKMWQAVAKELEVHVASIEYRKSPEYSYKEALEDALAVYFWFRQHAEEWNADSEDISVMGCSAGANLAAALCIMLNMQNSCTIHHQILIYPYLDAYTDPEEKGDGHPLLYLFNELHSTKNEAKSSLISPIYASGKVLSGLPETWICLAEQDILKEEGYAFAKKLKENHVPVHVMCAEHMMHEYFEAGFGDYTDPVLMEKPPEFYKMVKTGEAHKAAEKTLEFLKEAF